MKFSFATALVIVAMQCGSAVGVRTFIQSRSGSTAKARQSMNFADLLNQGQAQVQQPHQSFDLASMGNQVQNSAQKHLGASNGIMDGIYDNSKQLVSNPADYATSDLSQWMDVLPAAPVAVTQPSVAQAAQIATPAEVMKQAQIDTLKQGLKQKVSQKLQTAIQQKEAVAPQ